MIGMGYFPETQPDFTALNELGRALRRNGEAIAGQISALWPDAHRTRAGVHADGLNKFWWMYAPFNVPKLIGRPLAELVEVIRKG